MSINNWMGLYGLIEPRQILEKIITKCFVYTAMAHPIIQRFTYNFDEWSFYTQSWISK